MCGRYTLKKAPEVLQAQFGLEAVPEMPPRYNIAPTQQVAAVRQEADSMRREFVWLRWGLIPSWASDLTIGNKLLNARADTIATKPSFRSALRRRRCLILADGFFEWQGSKGKKQPFYFRVRNGETFAIAGLWESWSSGDVAVVSCTLITTEANDLVRPTHDRMPAILTPEAYDLWIDPAVQHGERVMQLLHPFPADEMTVYPVSSHVNAARNDDSDCVRPIALA